MSSEKQNVKLSPDRADILPQSPPQPPKGELLGREYCVFFKPKNIFEFYIVYFLLDAKKSFMSWAHSSANTPFTTSVFGWSCVPSLV